MVHFWHRTGAKTGAGHRYQTHDYKSPLLIEASSGRSKIGPLLGRAREVDPVGPDPGLRRDYHFIPFIHLHLSPSKMPVDLVKLEEHLSKRSYIEG